jgi:hypothetical protein
MVHVAPEGYEIRRDGGHLTTVNESDGLLYEMSKLLFEAAGKKCVIEDFTAGQKVRVVRALSDLPEEVPVGTEGTVEGFDRAFLHSIEVKFPFKIKSIGPDEGTIAMQPGELEIVR